MFTFKNTQIWNKRLIQYTRRYFFEIDMSVDQRRCLLIFLILVPRSIIDSFRKRVNPSDIKDEMLNSLDLDLERKMTPLKIKDNLDKYIIGQDHVKRAVAIALSKKYLNRRNQIQKENVPKIKR